MLIKEFRVPLPLSLEEYHLGQLWAVAEASKRETGGGEGIEMLINEPFTDHPLLGGKFTSGQYTYKIFHLKKKVPAFIRLLAPEGALEVHEKSWNAYPYSKTLYCNPYMKDDFLISVETIHAADRGNTENIHRLARKKWQKVEVVMVDIANDPVSSADYNPDEDPTKYVSIKTGRGPLRTPHWWLQSEPVMTCYKLVSCEFKWFGLQARVERYIQDFERRIITNFHRQTFCWLDKWYGLTIDDIRCIEDLTKDELDQKRREDGVRGTLG
ncbi:phosphatidylinositol transfer protein alpha isoform [Procambarus clarkii]|uniref:phosphatidylinositol transfer protein alpha isoform n=1 Tax=Procambarus clarkii TaxID=6728 RepID=UPI001E67565A|nr:phosphatidylinositol transfer protein alpha isoform-like [Procambarus clarkii]